MIYLALDTDVWIGLLKVDFQNEDNLFNELCFWLENRYITNVVPDNIIREWDRRKVSIANEAVSTIKQIHDTSFSSLKNNKELSSTYQPDSIRSLITARIERIDKLFANHTEVARESPTILADAAKRNLECKAPNHSKDSFRDSVNILTLLDHLSAKRDCSCYFSTLNYKDFSSGKTLKYDLHDDLHANFSNSKVEYVYFEDHPNFGGKLFSILRKLDGMPSYQKVLKEKRDVEQQRLIDERKLNQEPEVENPDKDFLENIKYLDMILARPEPTPIELEVLKLIVAKHESYRRYFLKNVK